MEDKYKKNSLNGPKRETEAQRTKFCPKYFRYLASKLAKRNMILLSCTKTAAWSYVSEKI